MEARVSKSPININLFHLLPTKLIYLNKLTLPTNPNFLLPLRGTLFGWAEGVSGKKITNEIHPNQGWLTKVI